MSKKVIVDKEGLITYHKYVKEEYMTEGDQAVNDMYAYRNELMANEQIRKDNEEVRKINEDNRVNAEIERLSAEQTRDANEKLRTEHYNADVVAEKARVAKENERITAEQQRVINENARLGDEQIRVNQENRRLSNEDNRNTSENIRQANERARQTNDSKRTSDVKTKITEVTQITNECNSKVNQSIANINSCIDDLKGFKNEHNASIEVINNTNQEQNARINNIVKKNKEQDIYINALLNEGKNKRITITEKSPELKLTGNSEGFVTVDKMVGDTLVNIHPSQSYYFIYDTSANEGLVTSSNGINYVKAEFSSTLTSWFFIDLGNLNMSMIKPNTKYTIIFKKNIGVKIVKFDNPSGTATISNESTPNNNMAVITTTNFINLGVDTTGVILYCEIDNNCLKIDVEDVIILEGDYTNKPTPSEYFQGMQSSFENQLVTQEMVDSGEELEENLGKYKCKVDVRGKNLLNLNDYNYTFGVDNIKCDNRKITGSFNKRYSRLEYKIPLDLVNMNIGKYITGSAKNYMISDSQATPSYELSITYKDNTKRYINLLTSTYQIKTDIMEVTVRLFANNSANDIIGTFNFEDLMLEIKDNVAQASSYEPYYERTKTVYLNSPLLKDDTIEEVDGKVNHVHKGEIKIFNGAEKWNMTPPSTTYPNICVFMMNDTVSRTGNYICDKFPIATSNPSNAGVVSTDKEGVFIKGTEIKIAINTSKLSTQDTEGFKQWLQANPTTVIYELAEPYYETIDTNKLLLEIPNNATLSVDSVIPPTTTVTYTTDIPDVYSLEETNINQYDLIDVSLMATDEIYMMLEPILNTTYSVREKEVNKNYAMINFYVKLVNRGLKDVDKVPEWLREDVIKELNK